MKTVVIVVAIILIIGYFSYAHFKNCQTIANAQQSTDRIEKKKLDPESDVMETFESVKISDLAKLDDPLHDDSLNIKTDYESGADKFERSIRYGIDGPAPEGMVAPYDDFERAALIRQEQKMATIYGEQMLYPTNSTTISELNI